MSIFPLLFDEYNNYQQGCYVTTVSIESVMVICVPFLGLGLLPAGGEGRSGSLQARLWSCAILTFHRFFSFIYFGAEEVEPKTFERDFVSVFVFVFLSLTRQSPFFIETITISCSDLLLPFSKSNFWWEQPSAPPPPGLCSPALITVCPPTLSVPVFPLVDTKLLDGFTLIHFSWWWLY